MTTVGLRYYSQPHQFPWAWGEKAAIKAAKGHLVVRTTLWTTSTLLGGGGESSLRQRIRTQIEESITAFAADWYKANPRK